MATTTKPKKSTRKTATKKSAAPIPAAAAGRLRRVPRPRLSLRRKTPLKPKGGLSILIDALKLLKKEWKLFGAITIVYFALTGLLVGGLNSNFDIAEVRDAVRETFSGNFAEIGTGLTLFSLMLQSIGASEGASSSGTPYWSVVIVIVSLAIIWSARRSVAGEKSSLKEAFYEGVYPLVPFVLILAVIGLQLLPIFLALLVYTTTIAAGAVTQLWEYLLWYSLVVSLVMLSLYLLASSFVALYVVTLPGMQPMAALRAARKLVKYRRWTIVRRVLFLPIALLVVASVITVPFLLYLPIVSAFVFAFLTMLGLVVWHLYMYLLYRELL